MLIVIFILMSFSAQAGEKKAIVCPPHLDYCYKKPVLPEKKFEDELKEITDRLDFYENQLRLRR